MTGSSRAATFHTATRWLVASGLLAYFLCVSLVGASALGWGLWPDERSALEQLRSDLVSLAASAVWGLVGIVIFRAFLGKRLISWWLAGALAIPVVVALLYVI